jgi:hypothetical protein
MATMVDPIVVVSHTHYTMTHDEFVPDVEPLPEVEAIEQEVLESFEPLRIGDRVRFRWLGVTLERHIIAVRQIRRGFDGFGSSPEKVYFVDSPGAWVTRRDLKKVGRFSL